MAWINLSGSRSSFGARAAQSSTPGASCGRRRRRCAFTWSPPRFFAFIAAACHAELAPAFDPLLRAAALVGIIAALDAFVIAPFAERSYAMFRSLMGTWLPFLAIFARRSVALVTLVRGLPATSAPGGIGPSRQVARPLPLPIV